MRREVKRTRLIVGEGQDEKVFLRHLCTLYRDPSVNIKVEGGKGGSPDDVVTLAIRLIQDTEYDDQWLLLDADVRMEQSTINRLREHDILRLPSMHCLEVLLLDILSLHKRKRGQWSRNATRAKRLLEKNIGRALDDHCCNRYFPKKALDVARVRLPYLDLLIHLCSGQPRSAVDKVIARING